MTDNSIAVFAYDDKEIRGVDDRFSVYDVLVAMGITQNLKRASEVYNRILDANSEVSEFCGYFKFPGRGQRETPITDREGMYQILMLCPGNKAAEFRKWAAGILADPDKAANHAITMYRNRGKSDKWIKARLEGLQIRHKFTDTLKAHGVSKYGYGSCTNAINKNILGATAREKKAQLGLTKNQPLRDGLTDIELAAIALSEMVSERNIERDNLQGDYQCRSACDNVSGKMKTVIE